MFQNNFKLYWESYFYCYITFCNQSKCKKIRRILCVKFGRYYNLSEPLICSWVLKRLVKGPINLFKKFNNGYDHILQKEDNSLLFLSGNSFSTGRKSILKFTNNDPFLIEEFDRIKNSSFNTVELLGKYNNHKNSIIK